jgi:hypothetical protein
VAKSFSRVLTGEGNVVCESCLMAKSPWLRLKGLLGRSELPEGEGILLSPASSIHMAFMRFSIDAVFLDRDLNVLRVVRDLAPWRLASRLRAHSVLELPAGTCDRCNVHEGMKLLLAPAGADAPAGPVSPVAGIEMTAPAGDSRTR